MKKILFTMFGVLLLASGHLSQAAEGVNSAPVTRVVKMCHERITEINIAALTQAAQVLETSRPELAGELKKMATEALE